jgi:hypothetical protein
MAKVKPISEREFMRQVIQLAHMHGWRHFHNLYSIGSDRGWPDLVLVHPKRGVIYAELKSEIGVLRLEQQQWLLDLDQAGQKVFVWRPGQLDEINRILACVVTIEAVSDISTP